MDRPVDEYAAESGQPADNRDSKRNHGVGCGIPSRDIAEIVLSGALFKKGA